jgi:hypothetical protein
MKTVSGIFRSLVMTIVCTVFAFAGAANRTGTSGASELLVPIGAREIAMGGAAVAGARGVDALFWNPAGTAFINSSAEFYFSHMSYIADIGMDYGAVSASMEGFGIISLSLKAFSIGEIPVTTTVHPDGTGEMFTPQYFTVGLSYARKLSERIAVGLTTNLVSERLGDVSATGLALNIGVIYENLANIEGLHIGVALNNIGPQMKFNGSGLLVQASVADQHRPPQYYEIQAAPFELPSSIEFGAAYQKTLEGPNSIVLSTAFQSNNFSDDEYRVGAEYAYEDFLFLRGGYIAAQKTATDREFLYGPSFGAGIRYGMGTTDLTFDYAYRSVKVFNANHVFSIKLGF